MRQAKPKQYALIAALLVLSPAASALNVETSLGVGMEYTDNARLTPSNEEEDFIANGLVGVSISESTGALTANATASLNHQNYLENTYDNQNYLDLAASARWEQIRDRLAWKVDDYFAQTPIDSLDSDTPDNTQDTNVFSFGPEVNFTITPRNSISLMPLFQDFYYEEDETDNQQYGLSADWLYQLYPTMAAGLTGVFTQVSYENEDLNPDYTISTLQALITGTRSRSEYTLKLGATHIDRDRFENQDEPTGSLDWLLSLSGKSSLRAFVLSDLSSSSNDLYRSATDPDSGDFTNVQVSGDVLRTNSIRLTYRRQDATFNTQLWGQLRDLDYSESPDDRKQQEYGVNLDYPVSSLLTTGMRAVYLKDRQTDEGRTDKEYILGGNIAYSLSRSLRCDLDVQYQQKDSTQSIDEYNEFRVFAGIVYDFFGKGHRIIGNSRQFTR